MYHYVNNLQTRAGDALVDYYVKLKDADGNYATLYADENSTPIISVSGVANAAKTDEEGMYDLWVADSIYDIEFFDTEDLTTLVRRLPAVPLFGLDFYADALEAVEDAEDAATAAQGSATTASVASAQAVAAAAQAAIYLAAFNLTPDMWFADEVTGRAAVADGETFAVITEDGYFIYERVDAVTISTLRAYMPSFAVTGPRQSVWCTASTSGFSANDFDITPIDAAAVLTGDLTQYKFHFQTPNSNTIGSGSVSITINQGDGTPIIELPLYKNLDQDTLDPNDYQLGDLMIVERMTDAPDVLRWLTPTDRATQSLAKVGSSYGSFGKRGSTARPLRYLKRHVRTHDIFMRFDESFYEAGQSRRAGDEIRIVEFDQIQYANLDTGNSLSLNSYMTLARGRVCHDLNMQFNDLEGGIVVETGRPPTAIEPPIHGGDYAEAVANARVSGVTHNNYTHAVTTLTLTYADASTSGVDTDVVIDPDAPMNSEDYGDKLVKTLVMRCTDDSGEVYCTQTQTVTYDPIADDQIRIQSEFDFTANITATTPGMVRGFAMVAAFIEMDRCQAIIDGEPQEIQIIDTRDDASIVLGFPEAVYFWHSDFPEKQILVTNNAGYGYTHEENGTPVANGSTQTYVASFTDGPYVKLYGGMYGDHSGSPVMRDMTDIVVTSDFSIRFLFAAERTNPA